MKSSCIDKFIVNDIQLEIMTGQSNARTISVMYGVPLDIVETMVEEIFDAQLQFLAESTGTESFTML